MQIQTFPCQTCGAEIRLRSPTCVVVMCQQCGSVALKEADALRDLGKMPPVLEDYSPIQIGSSGTESGRRFMVVGRRQLGYASGVGNEWYLQFEDGGSGWLGEFAGLYTLTAACVTDGPLPPLADICPAENYVISGKPYTAAEVRSGVCIGAQGELPFRIGDGWRVQAADFRSGGKFAILDYSDGPRPRLYIGREVTLTALAWQHLRDDAEITSSTGKVRGRINTGKCPSCGAAVHYVPGAAAHLICPACQTQLDATAAEIQALRTGQPAASMAMGLELGASALMQGRRYTVIGVLRRATEQYGEWHEYLLFSPGAKLTWLVETDDGWVQAKPQANWPAWTSPGADSVQFKHSRYSASANYEACVVYAAGAFSWPVAVGDKVRVVEFEKDTAMLAAEIDDGELTWSLSSPVAYDQMKAWFGQDYRGTLPPQNSKLFDFGNFMGVAMLFTVIMLACNAIPLFSNFAQNWNIVLIGAAALLLPAWFLDSGDKHA